MIGNSNRFSGQTLDLGIMVEYTRAIEPLLRWMSVYRTKIERYQ